MPALGRSQVCFVRGCKKEIRTKDIIEGPERFSCPDPSCVDIWFCETCKEHSVHRNRCSSKRPQSLDSLKAANDRVKRERRTKPSSALVADAVSSLRILFGDSREFLSMIMEAKHQSEAARCRTCLRDLVFAIFTKNGETFCLDHVNNAKKSDISTLLTKADISLLKNVCKLDGGESDSGLLLPQAGYYTVSGMTWSAPGRTAVTIAELSGQLPELRVGSTGYEKINLLGCTEESELLRLALHLKENEPDAIGDGELELDDRFRDACTLFITLKPGHGSPWHLDRLNAVNLAFSISESSTDDPVAIWYLCHDSFVSDMKKALRKRGYHEVHFREKLFTQEIMDQVAIDMGCIDGGYTPKLQKVYQYPGRLLRVNPGIWHTVLNIRPCVKIAFDVFRQGELCQYARILRNKFFSSGDIDDYARLETGLLGILRSSSR